ncbi:hypothetical protein ALNOE001_17760 [Candidatus Methanobinarius endosymbioticus]|uniref:Bacterial Ig-like domain-containing protein n=1 Tax=Candidatus Methanobinarius endosymbioticus TaxID=2006182 RepID=A0A366M8J8_9EURY|nr:hypothetical protein ALNOE001_17760 [Candidatus Methanobinarius endosymbioticus]
MNGTNNTGDYELLSYFLGQLYNETNSLWLNFLAKDKQLLKVLINKVTAQNLTIVVDNQVLRLGLVESEKAATYLNLTVIDNKDSFKLTAKLKSDFKNLSRKTIKFYLNGKLIGTGITNSKGIATFVHDSEAIGTFDFAASFEGNDLYLSSEDSESVKRYKPPHPINNSTNNSSNNPNGNSLDVSAKMQNTGIPIAILLVILAIILLYIGKKNKLNNF